ncbi:MAG TPA: hypothetical protein VFE37_25210 [Chloroflexota bacterium]|nr:hypothetical protein [Chloroflexota bacterium]
MQHFARALLFALAVALASAAAAPPVARAAPQSDAGTVRVVVDLPAPGSRVPGPVLLQGWAADPASASGTGVQRVAVYRDGPVDGGGAYLGEARYGLGRADVARALGADRFAASGFALPLVLSPGSHTLYVYAQAGDAWSAPTTVALDIGPQVVSGTPPPPHCLGLPTPFGPFGGLETPQSYGAIYPPDVPFVFGDPAFWLTYGNPNGPAYIDLQSGTVYTNSYFYQPRPARGIPLACPPAGPG